MHRLNVLPRFLAGLPYAVRLGIAIGCLTFCLVFYMVLFRINNNPSIMVIPTAIFAWMFGRRAMLLCVLAVVVVLMSFLAIWYKHLLHDPKTFASFAFGSSALVVLGLMISVQRDWFDRIQAGQIHEMQVKEQQQLLNQLKDQFILNVNHELRTPLTSVYGYLELLLERNNELDGATRATFLRGAIYSCEELQALINNVLGAVEMIRERDYCQLEALRVATVVREVIEHFDPRQLLEREISVNVPDYLFVNANAQYTRQVLRNLLSNAFKYSPVGSPISVTASLYGNAVRRDRAVPEICISVKDVGSGVPPDEVPLLFGQFVRLRRDLVGAVRGTGLGLYVSKQLVEAMGGHIWVESTGIAGEGSTFCFTLCCIPRPSSAYEEQTNLYMPIEVVETIEVESLD